MKKTTTKKITKKCFVLFAAGLIVASVSNAQIITTIAGGGSSLGDGGAATTAELYSPYLMAVDANDNLYIADYSHNEIRKVNKITGIITAFAGNGGGGQSTGDGGQATAAVLSGPKAIAFDAIGNMYISTGNRIRKVSTTGIITTFAGNDTAAYTGDGGQAAAAKFNSPIGLAIDGSGNLLIADNGNNVIRKINLSTGIVSTVIGNGNSGFSGDGGQATAAEIGVPYGVAVDASGNIYVTDNNNMRIRKVVNSTGIISTVAGNGGITYAGDGSLATASGLYNPSGITIDKISDDIIFADEKNNSVRRISASSGVITTLAGQGYSNPGFTGDGGLATAAKLTEPYGVTFSNSGNLYISDWYNDRIRMITNVSSAGINEISIPSSEIKLYPNPTAGNIEIETNSTESQNLTVTDINGNNVFSKSFKENNISLNLSHLCAGVYNISIICKAGVVHKRFVLAR